MGLRTAHPFYDNVREKNGGNSGHYVIASQLPEHRPAGALTARAYKNNNNNNKSNNKNNNNNNNNNNNKNDITSS